jgi:putative ABC transport system permease protein
MTKLFGIPAETFSVVLLVMLAAALGAVGVLAARNRVFLRLGIQSVRRRKARSALIVVGLMLGTTIIAAALATGDTMSRTIREAATVSLGQTDERISVRGAEIDLPVESGGATGSLYFSEGQVDLIDEAVVHSGLVDGVLPAIIEPVAVQDATSRQNEPRLTLFAADPARMTGFGDIRTKAGRVVPLSALTEGEAYLNADAADELAAQTGDRISMFAGSSRVNLQVKEVVEYDGAGTDGPAVLLPLNEAQAFLAREGLVKHVLVSNRGDEISGAELTDEVMPLLEPALAPLGLEADPAKRDALADADTAGNAFMSFFTTFGTFSIAAGVLLIFLIFVMLAAERRGELGIARAVGTRRGHLVQMFLFEGVAYDLLAAAVGALLGVAVAYVMVLVMAGAFAATSDLEMTYSLEPRSILIAFSIGVLLTFAVVTFSAWRVSRMNIVTAIRNLPEPSRKRGGRGRSLIALIGLVAGCLLAGLGIAQEDAIILGFGVSVSILSLVPLALMAGAPDRMVRTSAGIALVAWFVLPMSEWLLGDPKTNFSIFILSGIMIVVGATWAIMYNADVLLGALNSSLGRVRRLAPVLNMAIAYPLRSVFRTGVALAMFTLVVFTLVVGAITTGSFQSGFNDLNEFGGGFHVRATTSPVSPITDMRASLQHAGFSPADFTVVSSQSFLPVDARQVGSPFASYAVRGLDSAFLENTTYRLATRAQGFASDASIWRALEQRSGLAVVDPSVVPRRANFVGFAPPQDFKLQGFYLEDQGFTPVPIDVRDPQTGNVVRLTIIGVLSETAPYSMAGISTSQTTLAAAFGGRVEPTLHLFALRDGVDAGAIAQELERAFLANGMEADSTKKLLDDAVAANTTFTRLVQGFMGLGLIVGVAALGVITARSVVERRQQIGVLRAIGFQRGMVQLSFLLESSFIALTSIAVGTSLGVAVAYNVIRDSRQQPSWENMAFQVPWANLAIIFLAVYLTALATTFAPALRASRVYPAEALRYQ